MIHHQKINYVQNFNRLQRPNKNELIFFEYESNF